MAGPTHAQQAPLRLWYTQPAKLWEECLPLGNGRLGAMPDGGIFKENIVLNDIALWSGGPQEADIPQASQHLPEIRRLLLAGKNADAQALIRKSFTVNGRGSAEGNGSKVPFGCYQVLGNLHLQFVYEKDSADLPFSQLKYQRQLSLNEAIAKCQYTIGSTKYTREYFTSFDNDVIVLRLSTSEVGKISFTLGMDRPERFATTVKGQELQMAGQLTNNTDGKGMRYLTRVQVKPEGGKLIATKQTLEVQNATAVTIYISSATDFRGADFENTSLNAMTAATSKKYATEKAGHVRNFAQLFNRATLSLGQANQDALPTDERMKAFATDSCDQGLPVLYFQFGRYLLISSTRPGYLPPNLQGLWANSIQTIWNSDYHLNINVQMNYWPLEVTNLASLHEPFYTLVKGLVTPGEKTAKAYYNGKGWVAHMMTNAWGYTSPGEDPYWGASVSGSGWLCQMLWQHYEYTKDDAYLRKIYPILKGAAEFYLSTLQPDPTSDRLLIMPSMSPENAFRLPDGKEATVCASPTIDNQILRDVFTHVMQASERLKLDETFRSQLQTTIPKLPPNQIGKDGRLMEWLHEYQEVDPHHRHISHLWGLFPGNEITPRQTPQLAEAVRASLEARSDKGTGWSLAWKISCWARLQDGNRAFKLLTRLLQPTDAFRYEGGADGGSYANLFCACPPFQIDGNFGATAGLAEMLLQSQDGAIQLLPALPDAWSTGSFTGVCARGGVQVAANWEGHQVKSATLTASATNQFTVRIPAYAKKVRVQKNGKILDVQVLNQLLTISLKKGEQAQLFFL